MKPFQQAVLDELEAIANKADLEVLSSFQYSNVGTLYAKRSLTETVATVSFQFSPRHNIITFNDQKLGPGRMSYLMSEKDDDKLAEMLQTWRELVSGAGSVTE